jgi:hypothetical protein
MAFAQSLGKTIRLLKGSDAKNNFPIMEFVFSKFCVCIFGSLPGGLGPPWEQTANIGSCRGEKHQILN